VSGKIKKESRGPLEKQNEIKKRKKEILGNGITSMTERKGTKYNNRNRRAG